MKSEVIKNIANSIFERIEKEGKLSQPAVGRSDAEINGFKDLYWIVRQRTPSFKILRDINNNFLSTETDKIHFLEEDDSYVITRDSIFGGILLTKGIGNHSYVSEGNNYKANIISLAKYNPQYKEDPNAIDVTDGSISIDGESLLFRSLREELVNLDILLERKEKLKGDLEIEQDTVVQQELIKELEETEQKIRAQQESLKKYIITNNQLRDQPLLDKYQETIKRSQIFTGQLIINGGPGTGKTTALIQRISFLIHPSIEEYKDNFTPSEKDLLYNQNTGWIFFTPSELLSQYLKNAMVRESLHSDSQRVMVWASLRTQIFRSFGFVNPKSSKSFKISANGKFLFNNNSKSALNLIHKFEKFIVNAINDNFNFIKELNTNDYEWNKLASKIKNIVSRSLVSNNIREHINSFIELQKLDSESNSIIAKLDKIVKFESARIQNKCQNNLPLNESLRRILLDKDNLNIKNTEDLDDDDLNEEDEELEPTNLLKDEEKLFNLRLSRILNKIIQKKSLGHFKITKKYSSLESKVSEILTQELNSINYNEFVDLTLYKNYFSKLTKGLEVNIFKKISLMYKQFRKNHILIEDCCSALEFEEFKENTKSGNNKLFDDEIDLVLSTIFIIMKNIFNINSNYFLTSQSKFIRIYKDNMKMVVAIDEAIDFSPLELFSMSMLSYPKFNCVTLVGDIMQRMEKNGINNWESYKTLFPKVEIADMKISYRQSRTLLNISKKIFEYQTQLESNFTSAYAENTEDITPLKFVNNNFNEKIDWVAERVIEIYERSDYSSISIAIFVTNDEKVIQVANALNKQEDLVNSGIKAEACSNGNVLGSVEKLRIFNIKYIKGLEFNSVFFFDIDDMDSVEDELISRYFYVGLSRASLFLAVIANKEFPAGLSYVQDDFVEGNWKL